jgi:RHS repeat-associated protein
VGYLSAHGVRLGRLHYALDDVPRAQSGGLHVLFSLPDHLGSAAIVLDRDTGELVEKSTYQAYGSADSDYRPARWESFREDYRFTGKEEDVEVGLHYFGKRYYAPSTGRWSAPDPVALHNTSAGKDSKAGEVLGDDGPHADLNLYAYVRGRALSRIDQDGLWDVAQAAREAGQALVDFARATANAASRNPGAATAVAGGATVAAPASTPLVVAAATNPLVWLGVAAVGVPLAQHYIWGRYQENPTNPVAPAGGVQQSAPPPPPPPSRSEPTPPPKANKEPTTPPPTPQPAAQGGGAIKGPPNKDGCNGKADHQATVARLVDQAKQEMIAIARQRGQPLSDFAIKENLTIKNTKNGAGISRRPDVWIHNLKTNEVEKVYEAARLKPPTRENPNRCEYVSREQTKMEEYDHPPAGEPIKHHFEEVK